MKHTIQRLAIPTRDGYDFKSTDQLMYCTAEGNYCTLHFSDGSRYLVSKTLKTIFDILGSSDFVRIHQAHVVNLNFVDKYYNSKINTVRMINGEELAVSRRKKTEITNGITFL